MLHQKLARFFSSDIGIDLGTANCLVYVKDRGVVLSEPSVVAVNKTTRGVLAVGLDAKKMLGRTPVNIEAIRPMKDGVIADINITRHMLRYFIEKAKKYVSPRRRLAKPRIVIAVPTGITEVETSAVQDTATHAGASEVILLEEPMAAAIGIGLPVGEPVGSMIVDIGGGTTEVAIISLAGIVDSRSVRVGGDEMDLAIISNMKRAYQLMVGERTAENIKITIGNVYPDENGETEMEVKGRDLVSGLPKVIKISSREVRSWLLEPVTSIVEAVRTTLERCPPELCGDLSDHGIFLAGGGALLKGLDKLIAEEMNLNCFVADEPLLAVARGTGVYLQEIDSFGAGVSPEQ